VKLEAERWGSPLVQEEKACDKRHPYRIIIIILLLLLVCFFGITYEYFRPPKRETVYKRGTEQYVDNTR